MSPLEEEESGSLKVGLLSTPLREYSLHLLAAAAARCARSCISSSVTDIESMCYYMIIGQSGREEFTINAYRFSGIDYLSPRGYPNRKVLRLCFSASSFYF